MKNWKVILAIMTANVVMMAAGYTMLIPFLPMYLMEELGVSINDVKLWNGAIFSITFLIGGIMAPLWGRMADTKGKRLMALRAGAGLAISYYLGGMVTSPEQMFLVRVLQGFAAGLWSVCLAITTSFVPMEKLGLSLGIMQAALTTGNVIGPLLGGTLATLFGMRSSFFVAGTLLTIITMIFYFYIPEPPKTAPKAEANPEIQVQLLKRPAIRETLCFVAVVQMVILLIQPILALYVAQLAPDSDNLIFLSGFVFSLVGIASALTAPWWGRFGQSRGFYRALAYAAGGAGAVSFIVVVPRTLEPFCVMNFIYGLFAAGVAPSLSAILTSHTAQNERGRIFGYMFSAQQFGSMVGPILGGAVATVLPLESLFVLGGAVFLSLGLVAWRRR